MFVFPGNSLRSAVEKERNDIDSGHTLGRHGPHLIAGVQTDCLNPLAPCPPNIGLSARAYLLTRFYLKTEAGPVSYIHLIPKARGYRHKSFRLHPMETRSGWLLTITTHTHVHVHTGAHTHTQFLCLILGRVHAP